MDKRHVCVPCAPPAPELEQRSLGPRLHGASLWQYSRSKRDYITSGAPSLSTATRINGRRVFEEFRGAGEEIDSGGNVDAVPPYVSRSGVPYLNGRVLLGKHFDKYTAQSLTSFLESQGAQTPLFLEAGWLVVGHIDEMVQFLHVPYSNVLGLTVAVPDTRTALAILKAAKQSAHGSTAILSYYSSMIPDKDAVFSIPPSTTRRLRACCPMSCSLKPTTIRNGSWTGTWPSSSREFHFLQRMSCASPPSGRT
ncbi:Putative peptidylarginine deiminase [Tolypocladium paradoxum]|uniref:Peptidylarginine deiminase n=1 Tax=Tolypocladium paradoxum TaxID=94208 RepID=A0A2S4KXL8_9HYPO|nr:Putative peptidylarginine deiminase [Tolypocladium paradoxum]